MVQRSDVKPGYRIVLGLMAAVLAAAPGWAAAPEAWPYKSAGSAVTDPKEVKRLRQAVNEVLRSTAALSAAQETTLKDYYSKAVFAAMTRPEALSEAIRFPEWRNEIIRDLSVLAENKAAHDYLRDQVFNYAKQLAAGDFHPACRYNAMLILGELNETETRRAAGPRTIPAVPYTPAREILLRELSGNASDAQQIAALIGLQRHAKLLAATDNADSEIVRRMVDIVRAQPAAGTANVDALRWKQRLAVETLGLIGQPGAAPILEPIVLDDNLPLSLRVAAAKSLGQLEYADAGNLNTGNLLKGLGQVALSACRDEMQRMKSRPAEEANADTVAPPVPIIGGETTVKDAPENPVIRLSRSNLKYHLLCVRQGVLGVERIVTAPEQINTVTAMKAEIESILTALEDKPATMTPTSLLNKISPVATRLEQVVKAP